MSTPESFHSQPPTQEINRRTDDILYNVRYLHANIIDKETETFAPQAEIDVLEQNSTQIAEGDIHRLGAVVHQHLDPELGQYVSLGSGTIDNAQKGYDALDPLDISTHFELLRRAEETVDEEAILQPDVNMEMQAGATKVFIEPCPTHHETDPDIAISLGYDGRTMFRLQDLSSDGQIKTMRSFSVFDVPAKAWAEFLGDRYARTIEPTALAVMQFCNEVLLEYGNPEELLITFIGGVAKYVEEDERDKILQQLDGFLHDQQELAVQANYYAQEKLAFEKELALCLYDYARPQVADLLRKNSDLLNDKDRNKIMPYLQNSQIYVDDFVAELAVKVKTLTNNNRAGLAALNEQTVKRVASKIGLEATMKLAAREHAIQQVPIEYGQLMAQRNEQQIIESGVGCGGGCTVDIVNLFSKEATTAREAGLSGLLYSSRALNKSTVCRCPKEGKKPKVIVDGKNVVCVTCGDYKVGGKRGNVKQKQALFSLAKAA